MYMYITASRRVFGAIIASLFLIFSLCAVGVLQVYGAGSSSGSGTTGAQSGSGTTGAQSGSGGGTNSLVNPLKAADILQFLGHVIDIVIVFVLPIIILFIMYSGFLLVTARGDAGQITKGKTALLWAVVGGVIILGAKLLVTVIQGTVTAL